MHTEFLEPLSLNETVDKNYLITIFNEFIR